MRTQRARITDILLPALAFLLLQIMAVRHRDPATNNSVTPAPITLATAGAARGAMSDGCITCHLGIEEMHPGFPLSCVDCHGGNGAATTKDKAHVLAKETVPFDERVLPQNYDLAWQRFVNPSNLRVAKQVCGDCHENGVGNVLKSLHATTCGHLGDGFFEHGLTKSKTPSFGVFAETDDDGEVPKGALRAVSQVPAPISGAARDRIETHFADLPRKSCMQCHLWSEGRALRGRVGMDGDYRGEGCAACHVNYADDGRSKSKDATTDKQEPGHPERHRFTSKIKTSTCTHCHYGDASIGLSFRGLAQLVPGMPAGPNVPGTTSKLQNGTFYLQDKDLTPPDVHHQRGMHCIDCHTQNDVMGDGNIWPQMDNAVEIECESCHGTINAVSDLRTSKGRRVTNLERDGEQFFLRSKVTDKRHPVVQVKNIVDPKHPSYNPRAAAAMTAQHAKLECYSCHAAWNVDFFGFHFDRNEQFTQLDLLSGRRTAGRVTTQEKVFASFNQLRLGYNHEGRVANYTVGFSTIGSAQEADGTTLLDQALPATSTGLSGVSLVSHQPYTTRPEARDCVECHRAPSTWGLGSSNFRLTREFAFAIEPRGLVVLAIDRKQSARTMPVADLALPNLPRSIALRMDPVRGRATHAYIACDGGVLAIVDLRNPVLPRLISSEQVLADPRRLLAQGDHLYVADGPGGLCIFDLLNPDKPKLAGTMPSAEARGFSLAWPWLYLADGPGGFSVVDVANAEAPRTLANIDLNQESSSPNDAWDCATLFQYSRMRAKDDLGTSLLRTAARNLVAVAAGLDGVRMIDVTEPNAPRLLHTKAHERAFGAKRIDARGVAFNTQFDLGSQGGGIQSREHDYLFVFQTDGDDDNRQQHVRAFDLSDPQNPVPAFGEAQRIYGGTGKLLMLRTYNAPFLQQFVLAVGAGGGGAILDASKMPTGLQSLASWLDPLQTIDLAVEEFAFDRLQDERGRWEKDISHEDCRYLTQAELLRVLRARISSTSTTRAATGATEGEREKR